MFPLRRPLLVFPLRRPLLVLPLALFVASAAALLVVGVPGVMVRGVGESIGEGFPLTVSAPPPHRIDSTIVRAHQHATDNGRKEEMHRRDPQASVGKLTQPMDNPVNVVGETTVLRRR
ncbi:hypothetical protein [Streptomyces sp. NPDC058086]|uniref:hypothetical protein n=1 Tax=Streptomyces sp. NPDC058086 TaxID=3346334 RepID=UPI0036E65CFD